MKLLTRKNAGLVVMTALLGMPLTHAIANENVNAGENPSMGQNRDMGQDRGMGKDQGMSQDRGMGKGQGMGREQSTGQDQGISNDNSITSEVKSALSKNNDTKDLDVKVKTVGGAVSLSGKVSTDAERDSAISKVKDVKGVKSVTADDLKIDR